MANFWDHVPLATKDPQGGSAVTANSIEAGREDVAAEDSMPSIGIAALAAHQAAELIDDHVDLQPGEVARIYEDPVTHLEAHMLGDAVAKVMQKIEVLWRRIQDAEGRNQFDEEGNLISINGGDHDRMLAQIRWMAKHGYSLSQIRAAFNHRLKDFAKD